MADTIEFMAFSEDQVSALTGLSTRQLRYWDRKHEFFSPEYVIDGRRVYSFRDLVGLRTVATLRTRTSLQQLRKIDEELHRDHETPWAKLKFYLLGREVLYKDPSSSNIQSASRPGEQVFEVIDLDEIKGTTIHEIKRQGERSPDEIGQITKKRNVMRGKPVIAGTRIPTELIWDYHVAGFSTEKILRGFPRLKRADVEKAIEVEGLARGKIAS